jgi:hypothetical protein
MNKKSLLGKFNFSLHHYLYQATRDSLRHEITFTKKNINVYKENIL